MMNLSESYKRRLQELGGVINEAKMEDLYDKYFSDIPREDFDKITDSTPDLAKERNDYKSIRTMSNWLIDLYRNDKLKIEDLYKAKEYLSLLYSNVNDISKEGVDTDLRKYKNLPSLFKVVEKYKKGSRPGGEIYDETDLITNTFFIDKGDAEKIYEDERWYVVSPKTLEASKFYGCTSEWCTLFPDMFQKHNSEGPLYILIAKNMLNQKGGSERRLQFHFESEQFMDMDDRDLLEDEEPEMDDDGGYYESDDLMQSGEFLDWLTKDLKKWYLDKRIQTGGNLKGVEFYGMPQENVEELVDNAIKKKKRLPNALISNIVDKKFREKMIEKAFNEIPNYTLSPIEQMYAPNITYKNAERVFPKIEGAVWEVYAGDYRPSSRPHKLYRELQDLTINIVDENYQIKIIGKLVELAKKYSENSPSLYNEILEGLIKTINSGHLTELAKKYLYKNINKNEDFSTSEMMMIPEDKAKYLLIKLKRNKKLDDNSEMYNLEKSLGEEWTKKYIDHKMSQLTNSENPLDDLRFYPTTLGKMDKETQQKYLSLMFMKENSPKITTNEWREIKDDIKTELTYLAKTGEGGKIDKEFIENNTSYGELSDLRRFMGSFSSLNKAVEKEDEEAYMDYLRDKYL